MPQRVRRASHRQGVVRRRARRVEREQRREALLRRRRGHHARRLLRQLGRALGGEDHVRAVRQHHDLHPRGGVDAREQLVGRGVHRRSAVHHEHAELAEQPLHPVATRNGHHRAHGLLGRVPLRGEPRVALGHLLVHVSHVEARHLAGGLEQRHRGVRVVGVHVHAQGAVVADDEHGVTELLEQGREVSRVEALARDGEVRAVAEARRLVLGAVERRRRVLVLELRTPRLRAAPQGTRR